MVKEAVGGGGGEGRRERAEGGRGKGERFGEEEGGIRQWAPTEYFRIQNPNF